MMLETLTCALKPCEIHLSITTLIFLSKFSAAFFQMKLDVPRNVKGESRHPPLKVTTSFQQKAE